MISKLALFAALAIGAVTPVAAQDAPGYDASASGAASSDTPRSSDGSPAFGIEPYIGVMGGYESFDSNSRFGVSPTRGTLSGPFAEGVVGVNIPVGPLFVGAEGNAAKAFGDINWEYGVRARVGFRAGDSGMIYLVGGHQWIDGDGGRGFPDHHDWTYGIGGEVGPRDIGLSGITGSTSVRFRFQIETYNFDSIRPSLGMIFHF